MSVELSDCHAFDPSRHMNLEIKLQVDDLVQEDSNVSDKNPLFYQSHASKDDSKGNSLDVESKHKPDGVMKSVQVHGQLHDNNEGMSAVENDSYVQRKEPVQSNCSLAGETEAGSESGDNLISNLPTCNDNTLQGSRLEETVVKNASDKNVATSNVASIQFQDGTAIQLDDKCDDLSELNTFMKELVQKSQRSSSFRQRITKSKDVSAGGPTDLIHNMTENFKQLEKKNVELTYSLKQAEDKLSAHDEDAKRTIALLMKDSETKLADLTKKCVKAETEKQASVMNFARREKELLDLKRQKENAEQFARNSGKERDKMAAQLKVLRSDLAKLKTSHDKKQNENDSQVKEFEKMKEEIKSHVIKARWAENKLKSEVDSHRETKEKCEKMALEIQNAREETEQIRKNCQEMIKTYQESEEIKSNALDIELKQKMQSMKEKDAETEELRLQLKHRNDELHLLKMKHKEIMEEHQILKSKAECLDQERVKNERIMRGYEEVLNKQKATATQMNEKMQNIFDLESEIENLNATIEDLQEELKVATAKRDTALSDLSCKDRKEQELLDFTEKVSSKNTQLTVEVKELNSKLSSQLEKLNSYEKKVTNLQIEIQDITMARERENTDHLKSQAAMNSRLEEKEHTICQLLLQLEELKDEMRTVKRKNAASLKDLARQLNQVKKKVDATDAVSMSSNPNSGSHSADGGSMGSRTSSTTSLDRLPSYTSDVPITSTSYNEHVSVPETTIAGPDTLDRQMLIERIVRLQQIHAKKNEKIDFLNEHVQQLVEALQKKQRLLQHYIMREESGALAPPRERNDHQKRHGLTLELSIEINQKMQSVLEDTLLKNITLKESLEVLGKEVQRLSSITNSDQS